MIDFPKDKRFKTVEITQKIGISPERLRYWESLGIVKPEYIQCGARKVRRYSEEDVHRAVLVNTLIDNERYTLEDAVKKLDEETVRGSDGRY